MDEQESPAPKFIPKDLLDIICILERDERRHSYKIVQNRTGFSLKAKLGRQECRIDAIEEQRFRSTNSESSGQETTFFRGQAAK